MNDNSYVKELRKDIKVIKKDLRAISIKTRSMARVLEISEEKDIIGRMGYSYHHTLEKLCKEK